MTTDSGSDVTGGRRRVLSAICVYCGSSSGDAPAYEELAISLGRELVRRDIGLVYGGGEVGLMGSIADAVLDAGGTVTGIIPTKLFSREVAHRGVTELIEVSSMHERKTAMFDAADAFIALPGGLGTLEELAEVATWAQIGVHDKPIGVLDVAGYWEPLFAWLDGAVAAGFVKAANTALFVRDTDPVALVDRLATHHVPAVPKWLDRDEV